MSLKNTLCAAMGMLGAAAASLFGGWTSAMTTLVILMMLDYTTGIVAAAFMHKSTKSESGGLESRAGWRGISKKVITLMFVLVAHRLDITLGTDYIKNSVTIAFSVNECISLIENAGLIGIPMPDVIIRAIDILKGKDDENH